MVKGIYVTLQPSSTCFRDVPDLDVYTGVDSSFLHQGRARGRAEGMSFKAIAVEAQLLSVSGHLKLYMMSVVLDVGMLVLFHQTRPTNNSLKVFDL